MTKANSELEKVVKPQEFKEGDSVRQLQKIECKHRKEDKILNQKICLICLAGEHFNWHLGLIKRLDTVFIPKYRPGKEELDIFNAATDEAKKQFKLDINSLHGIRHWERVREIGDYLAEKTGADFRVVTLFAALHDSCRENEGSDMLHGHRAVEYLSGLNNKGLLLIDDKQLDQLAYACEHHSKRSAQSDDITIKTCWDADRLDLYRVGEIPDPAFLYTETGKSPEAIDFALQLYLKSR